MKLNENVSKYFSHNTSLEQIDKYVRLVLKTFDSDDEVEVFYQDRLLKTQFVQIRIHDRIFNSQHKKNIINCYKYQH